MHIRNEVQTNIIGQMVNQIVSKINHNTSYKIENKISDHLWRQTNNNIQYLIVDQIREQIRE